MSKLDSQNVYPTGNQAEHSPDFGITYRQWLAGQIAGHVVTDSGFLQALAGKTDDDEKAMRMVGKAVWIWADAIIKAETAVGQPEQYEA